MKENEEGILKVDVLGRVWNSPERREAILDAFEASGLPGTVFADRHGINYQTFATWIQKRRRKRGDYDKRKPGKRASRGKVLPAKSPPMELTLAQVVVKDPLPDENGQPNKGLRVELPGGATLVMDNARQAALAAELIRLVNQSK